jgi:hypothetical protein
MKPRLTRLKSWVQGSRINGADLARTRHNGEFSYCPAANVTKCGYVPIGGTSREPSGPTLF